MNSNTSYGTISSTLSTGNEYTLFGSGYLQVAGGGTATVTWIFPNQVKFTSFTCTPKWVSGTSNAISSFKVKIYHQGSWIQVGSKTGISLTNTSPITINLDQYKTDRVQIIFGAESSAVNTRVYSASFQGYTYTEVLNSVTFPASFTNTDYAYSLGFQGASGSDVYVNNKTISGMTINSFGGTNAYWIAIGY